MTGRTAQAAKYIKKGLETGAVVTSINVHKAELSDLENKDLIVFGTPVYFGSPAMELRRFLNKLPENALAGKKISTSATYLLVGSQATLATIEEIAMDKGADQIIPGLARRSSFLGNLWQVLSGSTEDEEAWDAFGKSLLTS